MKALTPQAPNKTNDSAPKCHWHRNVSSRDPVPVQCGVWWWLSWKSDQRYSIGVEWDEHKHLEDGWSRHKWCQSDAPREQRRVWSIEGKNPHFLWIHCIAHRLALSTSQAANGVLYLKWIQEWVTSVFYYFRASGTREDTPWASGTGEKTLHQIEEVLEHPVLKIRDLYSTLAFLLWSHGFHLPQHHTTADILWIA